MYRSKEFEEQFGDFIWPHFESFHIWKGWHFPNDIDYTSDPVTGLDIVWCEVPKWVASTRTHDFMPSTQTRFSNLWLAGAHVRTSLPDMYSMEAACESGIRAANCILQKLRLPQYPLQTQSLPSHFALGVALPFLELGVWLGE